MATVTDMVARAELQIPSLEQMAVQALREDAKRWKSGSGFDYHVSERCHSVADVLSSIMARPYMPPPNSSTGTDRVVDCELYLEPILDEMAACAIVKGWSEDEVEEALAGLVRNRVLSKMER